MAEQKFYYGGQAVIEGVMMRGKKVMATAMRRPNGEIGIDFRPLSSLYTGKWRKMPLVRGIIVLIESMVLGIQTLMTSANVALEEEQTKLSGWTMWGIILGAMAFAVAVFFIGPLYLTNLMRNYLESSIVFNLIEGIIRVAIFIGYLKLISMMGDIKRVFAYHGAEHKSINAYEAGVPLDVESTRPFSTANPRCGTSFLFAVMLIAILVFSLVGKPSFYIMIASRVLLLPVIAALGYEFIYFTSRHSENLVMRAILTPGLWLQKLTTREPDDKQIEVGLAALKRVLEDEQPARIAATAVTIPAVAER
ncbi:MAG: DUF1385 domain-containing protein [Dehalococcoidales bacterium]|nr:DUF1385 domain-containing protein [Dehalococcoidales bacterium]